MNRPKRESARVYKAILGFFLSLVVSFYAQAADVGENRKESGKSGGPSFSVDKKAPIFITSNQLEVDRKKNTIVYKGRVVTVQGEMTINSEALTAYYDPEMKQLREVVAEGKVNVTQGNRVATGGKAVFNQKEQTLVLTGDPVVRQGNSQVAGSRIIFFIEQDRAVAEGGNQRVKATIFPDELGGKEKSDAGSEQRR